MNEISKRIQKLTGIKQGKFDNDKNRMYNACQTALMFVKSVIMQCEALKMTDEQFFIDFEDELNELSIKDHNADSIEWVSIFYFIIMSKKLISRKYPKIDVAGMVNAIYDSGVEEIFPKEEPLNHYFNTISDEEADALGYFPDERGHRDDAVKLESHPSHPSRGQFKGYY